MRTTSWIVALALAATALSGCKKKEEDTAASASAAPAPEAAPAAPAPADTGAAPADGDDDVKHYPGETPMSGTVRVKIPFNAYKEADITSEKLGGIPAGTLIDLKATYSNWMLVEFPVGVGELGPGWIQLPNINDSRVQAATDADKKDRPVLKLRPKKKKPHK